MRSREYSAFREARHRLWVLMGAGVLTLMFFLVLPLMQTIAESSPQQMVVDLADTGQVEPPPPPPVEEEPEEEPEPEEPPPELMEEAPPLDLSQLELALNPGFSDGWMAGADFAVNLKTFAAKNEKEFDSIFSLSDLDQKPRAVYQPSPKFDAKLRKRAPGTVYILFLVNEKGRVEDPRVQKSTDPIFERAALAAVKRWRFEPGKRGGKSVTFRMRAPITFPKKG